MLPLSLIARKLYRNGDGFQLTIYNNNDSSLTSASVDIEQETVGGVNEGNSEHTISHLIV